MKILVCIKRVVDYNVRVRAKLDGSGVELANVKMAMNPFDEIAVEEAVRLREKGVAAEVVALSLGADGAQETLRVALAMGADRAVHVAAENVQPLGAAKLIKAVAEREKPQLIILGKQAIDDDANQTGQMVAALLNWPQATFASKIELIPLPHAGEGATPPRNDAVAKTVSGGAGEDHAIVTREVDGGLVSVKVALPAVITTDLRLNEPRYPSMPNIMKAKSKPLAKMNAVELGVDIAPRLTLLKAEEPPKRKGGAKVKDTAELVAKLKDEAKVI